MLGCAVSVSYLTLLANRPNQTATAVFKLESFHSCFHKIISFSVQFMAVTRNYVIMHDFLLPILMDLNALHK